MERPKIEFIPKCLAVSFKRKSTSIKNISGEDLFTRFVNINNYCFWNINLKEVFDKCELLGHVRPHCLLITAPDLIIESIKLAHQKRLLKAPESFVIQFLGDVDSVSCSSTTPSQFVSLDEALCYVIFDLNLHNEASTFELICGRLTQWHPGLQLPPQFLILATLRNLIDAGQVYYTGYGYNIMTTDKIFVAQWLGEQRPEEVIPRTNSLTDLSVAGKTDVQERSISERVEGKMKSTKTIDPMQFYQINQAPNCFMHTPVNELTKKPKSRSTVKQFFSKFRSGHHKSNVSSLPANNDSIYDEESNYYAFTRAQPKFYSSNLEFIHRSMTTPIQKDNTSNIGDDSKPKWLWRTSLQSLPLEPDSHRRSSSSHSRISTQAIHDESPPPDIVKTKNHRFKSKSGQVRSKSKHSLTKESTSSRDKSSFYATHETFNEDSGIHSISGSNSKTLPNNQIKYNSKPLYSDIESEKRDMKKAPESPPISKTKVRTHQRMSRSYSTRLSSISANKILDPVSEGFKWDTNDDKHVVFKDPYGTAY